MSFFQRAAGAVAAVALLAACSSGEAATGSGQTGTIVVTDAAGATHELDGPAQRIVCLDGSCLDALDVLGLEPVASTQFDFVTSTEFWGPETDIVRIDGSFFEPDLEGIVAAEPDLILATRGVHADLPAALDGVAPVFLQSIPTVEAARDYLLAVGEMTGRADRAREAVEAFDAKLDAYAQQRQAERVVVTMYGSDLDFGIDAADSIVGNLLARVTPYPWPEAGEGSSGFMDFSVERLLEVDPDVIFVQSYQFSPDTPPLSEQMREHPLWGELKAVQSGDVYEVDTAWWSAGRTIGVLERILDTVMTVTYPEEFPTPIAP